MSANVQHLLTAANIFNLPLTIASEHCRGWEFCWPESIKLIREGSENSGAFHPPYYGNPARIDIAWDQDLSIIWHEAFHCAAQRCPLNGDDLSWVEGFCNAFAAANSGLKHEKTELTKVHFELAPSDHHMKTYTIPEMLLRNLTQDDPAIFKAFWFYFCENSPKQPGLICRTMKFNPVTGVKIQ